DRRRQIVGDGDPFECPADLRAERADRLPVVRVLARQPVELIVDRRRFRHDPPEGIRRHAEASRHAYAFDPRKLAYVRALAANDCDLRLVDLLETQHVAAHPSIFPSALSGLSHSCCQSRRPPVGQLVACSVRTPEPLQHDPHPQVTLLSLEMSLKDTWGTQPSTGPIPKHGANGATGFRRRAVSVQARRESRSSTGQPEELT